MKSLQTVPHLATFGYPSIFTNLGMLKWAICSTWHFLFATAAVWGRCCNGWSSAALRCHYSFIGLDLTIPGKPRAEECPRYDPTPEGSSGLLLTLHIFLKKILLGFSGVTLNSSDGFALLPHWHWHWVVLLGCIVLDLLSLQKCPLPISTSEILRIDLSHHWVLALPHWHCFLWHIVLVLLLALQTYLSTHPHTSLSTAEIIWDILLGL